jgi:hypothetical protein
MVTRLENLVFDCADPIALGTWWMTTLGWTARFPQPDEIDVVAPGEDRWMPSLLFLTCADTKVGKNRVHLDLGTETAADHVGFVAELCDRGATRVDLGQTDAPWVVLADPEGNEFCVLEPRPRYLGCGRLAAVVIDSRDPLALAQFWAQASGWSIGYRDDDVVSLHRPSDRPPDIDFVRNVEPKLTKLRVHLDVAPTDGDSLRAEADRLVAAGAGEVDIGQHDDPATDWIVLVDPEGNEFCVVP